MAAAVDVNDNLIVAGCDNAVIGVWDAADAAEINLLTGESGSELIGSLKLGNVWVFVQQIFCPRWPMNQLNKNPNIA